jgi:protocatechuate 3,4-dioxygenase beta subunit
MKLTRRQIIKALAALPIPAAVLSAIGVAPKAEAAMLLPATPELEDADDPTPPLTEGPFYKPKSPRRSNLIEFGMQGEKVVVSGKVTDRKGNPVANAQMEVWHADSEGEYDNVGFRCRGHFFTEKDGTYKFTAVYPGLYPGRTRHYHIRVQAPSKSPLTTQLFFPGEPGNTRDGIFLRELVMKVRQEKDRKDAAFDFVLNV